MKQTIDLHMHSLYSDDGEYTPSQLVEMCHSKGIKLMAIADHNSVKGVKEGMAKAQNLGMQYLAATEIDCHHEGINLHVVGYGIDYTQPIFSELEENILSQELQCSHQKLLLTNQLGFELTQPQLDTLSSNGVYTGEMFAEVLLNDERYTNHALLEPYRKGGSRSDNPYVNFYWDYYAQGKPCYTKVVFPTLKETIDIIHNNGGIAVLAHPGNNLKGNFEIIDEMIALGLDGIEAFSSYHNEETNQYFYDKAILNHLVVTCGSDFHGKTKPAIHLGETGSFVEDEEILKRLKEKQVID